ncbi:MAG: aspartate-semialdehyde dehydrogenase [Candidatus Omnitrophica bacterium]|nr:aspartate-semialdehyde dehydrogenase [Candidatus Omnitrophota bacterium]MBU1997468.1 aspartate-semialdehyde dehydrogenase [Candidatus Omnitrophota bacterium]MBU4333787.1 aspartate-semialdehyde dehydrogenase [Candidatus Omnitrophota bacterium]
MKKYNVAIVGIRGVVGDCMFEILKERKFPINELRLLSFNPEEANRTYEINGKEVKLSKLTHDAFKDIDIGLFSPGAAISKEYAPHAVKAGCIVIDNTSQFRMDPDVPLVVPEVNPEDIKKQKGIIANPNCSTIQMVVALKPLHDYAKIKRIVVSTYQAVSGAGALAINELKEQLSGNMKIEVFPYQIAHNLIPQIDVTLENLYTKEEMKMVNETKKIMKDDSIKVTATCVRVPVFGAHSESVNIETEKKITREKAIELLSNAPGITIVDDLYNNKYPTPLEVEGKDNTFVGRIREDDTINNGLNLWIVSDNLRKGAALNAVQIAEELIKIG